MVALWNIWYVYGSYSVYNSIKFRDILLAIQYECLVSLSNIIMHLICQTQKYFANKVLTFKFCKGGSTVLFILFLNKSVFCNALLIVFNEIK